MNTSYALPIAISVVLHAILVLAVAYGWEASSRETKKVMPRFVEAKLVQLEAKTVKKPAAQPKPKKIDLTKRREQERQRQLAEEKKLRAQALKEQQEKERKEKQRKEQERKKREQELERQRQLEEQRQLKEQRQREERERERQRMEEAIAEEMAEEEERLLAEQYEATAQSYVALIAARIEQNWSRPPSARKGMQCEILLQLVPTGQVVNVTISKSSGNSAFDRSAEQAVKKVERFEELQKVPPQVFERHFRQLRLVFNPQDLRQ